LKVFLRLLGYGGMGLVVLCAFFAGVKVGLAALGGACIIATLVEAMLLTYPR